MTLNDRPLLEYLDAFAVKCEVLGDFQPNDSPMETHLWATSQLLEEAAKRIRELEAENDELTEQLEERA